MIITGSWYGELYAIGVRACREDHAQGVDMGDALAGALSDWLACSWSRWRVPPTDAEMAEVMRGYTATAMLLDLRDRLDGAR